MPASAALSSIRCDSASSVCLPNVAVPRHKRETGTPVRPNFVSCMARKSFGLDSRQAAVDRQVDTGDVAALVRGEEQSCGSDLLGTRQARQMGSSQ